VKSSDFTQANILEAVAKWSKEDQLKLIRSLLYQLGPDDIDLKATTPRRPTLKEAAGLLKNDNPAPTDEEVEKLLRERREEKYG